MKKSFLLTIVFVLVFFSFNVFSQSYNYDFNGTDDPSFHPNLAISGGELNFKCNSYSNAYQVVPGTNLNVSYRMKNRIDNDEGTRSDGHIIFTFTNSSGISSEIHNGTSGSNWTTRNFSLAFSESGTLEIMFVEYRCQEKVKFDYLYLLFEFDAPAPVAVTADNIGEAEFTAQWNAYPDALSYDLEVYREDNSGYQLFQDLGNTSFEVTSLDAGSWYYRVRANMPQNLVTPFSNVVRVNLVVPPAPLVLPMPHAYMTYTYTFLNDNPEFNPNISTSGNLALQGGSVSRKYQVRTGDQLEVSIKILNTLNSVNPSNGRLILRLDNGVGDFEFYNATTPNDNNWHILSTNYTIPADGLLEITMMEYSEERTAFFDDLTVKLSEPAISYCEPRPYNPIAWDWRSPTYNFYVFDGNQKVEITDVESPWYSIFTPNENINLFTQIEDKGFDPEDGWVLVRKDFGDKSTDRAINHPYFAIYNRYTGILRYFVALTKIEGIANEAVISLDYEGGSQKSAVSRHQFGYLADPIETFDRGSSFDPYMISNSYAVEQPYYWMHADFPMAYDPCICNDISQFKISTSLISTSTLRFETEGTAIGEITTSGKIGNSGIVGLTKVLNGTVKEAQTTFKNTESGLKFLDEEILPLFGYTFVDGVFNTLGTAGGALGALNGFISALKKDGQTSSQPISLKINLESEGTITTSNPHAEKLIYLPGSQEVSASIVEYDNPMGIATILKSPSFEMATRDRFETPKIFKIKLTEDISYAVNPYSDLVVKNAKAAIVIETKSPSGGLTGGFTDPPVSYVTTDSLGENDFRHIWVSDFYDLSCIKDITLNLAANNPFYDYISYGVKLLLELESKDGTYETVFMDSYRGSPIEESQYSYFDDNHWTDSGLNCKGYYEPSLSNDECSNIQGNGRIASTNSIKSTLSIEEDEINGFTIYPNPIDNIVHLNSPYEIKESVEVQLIDIHGVVLETILWGNDANHFDYDISEYKPGLYILKIKEADLVLRLFKN